MGKRTPEGEVKRAILEWLKHQPNCSVFPVATTGVFDPTSRRFRKSTGRIGCPDILVCWSGQFVGIEVKSKTGRPSKAQLEVGKDIERAGGRWVLARSIEDVAAAMLRD